MNRKFFQDLSKLRVKEARTLLDAELYQGAYYLLGYSVECGLKACVARQVKKFDFPDKKLANEAFTHDLEKLVRVAGLAPDFSRDRKQNEVLALNWAVVKDWSEASRYLLKIGEAEARDLFSACTQRNGILPWIRKKW